MIDERKRYPLEEAKSVALDLICRLGGACQRMQIAGSIRRQKPVVGDIELLYIPRYERRPKAGDMFESEDVSCVDIMLNLWEIAGILKRRLNVNGQQTYGKLNKLMVHVPSGIPVDLFATDAEKWWTSLVIRTGGKETNLRLTNGAIAIGRHLHAYGAGVTDRDGSLLVAQSEQDVFGFCGVPYQEPEKRA